MAIKINLEATETELFCSSKWWGDPDMPADMEYPTAPAQEDGETFDYPLTFVCQIDCEDIAPFDPEGKLPHKGMFYIFAGLDEYLDYDSPWHNGIGPWEKKQIVVKYTKAINFETFRAAQLVDENDEPLTQPALKMTFEPCEDGADGTCLLGKSPEEGLVSLLRIASGTAGLSFPEGGSLSFLYAPADFAAGKWKLVKGYLK